MESQHVLAVIQTDLQLICTLRGELGGAGFPSLNIARNSEEAVLYMRGVGIYSDRLKYPVPNVLILDCNNSDGSDLHVLSWVREQPPFRDLPILLLCNEHHDSHHVSCALDGSCYILERDNTAEIIDAIRNLETATALTAGAAGH